MFLATLALISSTNTPPSFIKTELAGVGFDVDFKNPAYVWDIVLKDDRSDWCLIKSYEDNGHRMRLELTRDQAEVGEFMHGGDPNQFLRHREVSREVFPGYSIGDTDSKLVDLIGNPTKVTSDGPYRRFHYLWSHPDRSGKGVAWDNEYVFRAGRMVEATFIRNDLP